MTEEKLIKELRKGINEIKLIKLEYEEAKQELEESKTEYEQLIKAHNKTIPLGLYL